jgi:thioredoxin reductase (NADPH)
VSGPEVITVDVAVVGGGPAGATAAFHLARQGFAVRLIDPLGIGGALINVERLPDYPGFPDGVAGWDLAAALGEQALSAGVAVTMGRAGAAIGQGDGWAVPVADAGVAVVARAVIIATGCRPRPLPGDDGTLEGNGVSYCAACDGGLFAGQAVVVVGDDAVAMAEAISLAPLASTVTVAFSAEEPQAGRAWLEAASAFPNVRLLAGQTVTTIHVDEQGRVIGVAASSTSGERRIDVAGVFGALDPLPNSELIVGLAVLDVDGRIPVDRAYAVPGAAPGLFAAGDVRAGAPLRAVAAAGDGAGAAAAIGFFLRRPGTGGTKGR